MDNGTLHICTANFSLISLNLMVGLSACFETSILEQITKSF